MTVSGVESGWLGPGVVRRHRRPSLGVRDVPVCGLLMAIIAGGLWTVSSAPVLGLALVLASLALAGMMLRERRSAAETLARAIDEALELQTDSFFIDPVTGLGNQRQLLGQLPREVARAERYGQPVSLAVIEIADLEVLRERWGTVAAGRAVFHVAGTLKRITPQSHLAIRLDGARFAVLIQGKSPDEVTRFCERVRLAAGNRPLERDSDLAMPVHVTVAISSVEYEADRFRGPLEFLSAAKCDLAVETARAQARKTEVRDLRRRLVAGYEAGDAGEREQLPVQERKAV